MEQFLVFAGTTEGVQIASHLAACHAAFTVFVATEYGSQVLPPNDWDVHVGRLEQEQMAELLQAGGIVIDATHPYAALVSQNLKRACADTHTAYFRLLRPSTGADGCLSFANTQAAAEYLNQTQGNVLLTTGSKELAVFAGVCTDQARLYARVLPTVSVVETCVNLGYAGKNLICMQGPFSKALNAALLRQIGASYLVTKDTGAAGGFGEKVEAANECGVTVLVIDRPACEEGMTFAQLKALLLARYHLQEEVRLDHFPLFIPLRERAVLVVGGGAIACRRIQVLLRFGARVRVIAPTLCQNLPVEHIARCFEPRDVEAHDALVLAATNDRAVNRAVGQCAKAIGVPVSVADSREESSFYFPAILEGKGIVGGLISTNGEEHALVKAYAGVLRKALQGEGKI